MAAKKIIIAGLLLIIAGIAIFLFYIGFFSKITVEEKNMGPYVLVYDDYTGDYKGTAKIQDDIYYALLNKYNIETFKGFGIYYDNPREVPKEKLRSSAGCILEISNYSSVDKLKENNFKIKELPEQEYIVAEFPFKNPMSVAIGVMRVYPEMNKYAKKNGLMQNEVMEIYDVPTKKIIYLMRK